MKSPRNTWHQTQLAKATEKTFMDPITFVTSYGITTLVLGNMACRPFINDHKARQAAIFNVLKGSEQKSLEDLTEAIGGLAAQEKLNRPVSPRFIKNLEELLSLSCLDACHPRVAEQVYDASADIIERQDRAVREDRLRIKNALRATGEMRLALLWDPECTEIFEATKADAEPTWTPPSESGIFLFDLTKVMAELRSDSHLRTRPNPVQARLRPLRDDATTLAGFVVIDRSEEEGGEFVSIWDPECATVSEATTMDAKQAYLQFNEEVRHSVESLFDRAKEIHETQRQLADALREHDKLLQSYNRADQEKAVRKWGEVTELREKLVALSKPDTFNSSANEYTPESGTIADIVVASVPREDLSLNVFTHYEPSHQFESRWKRAALRLVLLMGRFQAQPAVEHRQEQIAALFDAVGATPEQRDEIQSCINSLYGAIRRRWEDDPWIKKMSEDVRYDSGADYSPFSDRKFGGWKKEKNKRRRLFLAHYDKFQFKSPRQFTEEALIQLVEKMELKTDKYFVRDTRREQTVRELLERAEAYMQAGNSDAALAECQNAKDHAPDSALVLSALGYVHRRTGNFDTAVAEYQNANRLAPDETSPLFSLAYIYAMRGENLQEAVALIQRALPLFPQTEQHNIACARQVLGWLYLQQGEAEKALGELADPALQQFATPIFYLVLGDACKAAEQHQAAEQAWQAGLELANTKWTHRPGATPFEAREYETQRTQLRERLGIQENDE